MDIPAVLGFRMVMSTRIAVMAGMKTLEMVRMLLVRSMLGIAATISIVRIVRTIYMAVEPRLTVIPATGATEVPALEPLRSIVAIRSAAIRRKTIIPIRASWLANTNAD